MGFGGSALLARLPKVAADEAASAPQWVRFRPEIEPLVRLLEDTPRDRLLEEVASKISKGTTYREILTALQLAGVRNIQPRPVGFKFHAVLVINSAHLASQHSPDSDRWLPIFWALDQFKSSQARDVQEGDWTMSALNESAIPLGDAARTGFTRAMDVWDEPAADVAAAGLARTVGAQEAFDRFCWYGARDFRDIGHKAIYVANSWRTLQNIGWQHAEPVLRSLAYALLERDGQTPPAPDSAADQPGKRHAILIKEMRPDWQTGHFDSGVVQTLHHTFRTGSWEDAGNAAFEQVQNGIGPSTVWEAIFATAAELLMRRPGIATLHAVTTANAMHYLFQHTSGDLTRRFLLLQAAAFMPLFRSAAGNAARHGLEIDTFEAEPSAKPGNEGLEEIFAELEGDRTLAARRSFTWLQHSDDSRPFTDAARRWIYLKGTDSHDYKFSSAVLEDHLHLSPALKNRYLAASVFWLKGSAAPDSRLVARTRAALS